jgi:hypothetical protein
MRFSCKCEKGRRKGAREEGDAGGTKSGGCEKGKKG